MHKVKFSYLNLIFTSLVFVISTNLHGQGCPMEMGMNLYFNNYYSREVPFANLMMQSYGWITGNDHWVQGGLNKFNTEVIDSIARDNNGYPYEIPVVISGQEAPQIVKNVLALDNGGILPTGQYVVLYDGDGIVELIGEDVNQLLSFSSNRLVYQVKVKNRGDLVIQITKSNKNNHVRNLRVLLPGTESTFNKSVFNPVFIDKLKNFNTIRFLNWTHTNNSKQKHWDDRPLKDYHTQGTKRGVAYEYMIDLCNEINANMWINVPHAADENYVLQLSSLIEKNLKPNLKVYLEYSNELWNSGFNQYQYVEANGAIGVPHQFKYAEFAIKCFQNFGKPFQNNPTRLVRVVCGQQASPIVISQSIAGMNFFGNKDAFEAISCTGSLGLTPEDYKELESLGAAATKNDVNRLLKNNIEKNIIPLMNQTKEIADGADKFLVAYESVGMVGAHFDPTKGIPNYTNALYEFQKDSAMYDIYNEWLSYLRDEAKVKLNMSFVLADDNKAAYGSYGHLETVFQQEPWPLTYQVLIDNNCNDLTKNDDLNDINSVKIYPNPIPSNQDIIIESSDIYSIDIYNLIGKHIYNQTYRTKATKININASEWTNGIYFAKVNSSKNKSQTIKIIK